MPAAPLKLSLKDVMDLEDKFSVTLGAPTGVQTFLNRKEAKHRTDRGRGISKSKIVAHIAQKVGTPKRTAANFLEELFNPAVRKAKGDARKFVIRGTGVVKAHRKSGASRHPQTGKQVKVKG